MIEVYTPSRLHFGLLAYSRDRQRQFGGVGLMIRRPNVAVRVSPASEFSASGRMADRALEFARRFRERTAAKGLLPSLSGAHIHVNRVPRPHTGLGSGTQLGMAVGYALAQMADPQFAASLDARTLAPLVGRGERSAIGAYGFFAGGLIVEGGKLDPGSLSPMLLHQPFPPNWRVVLIRPSRLHGLNGPDEHRAFAVMPDIPRSDSAEMCRLVLLGLIPAMLENDLESFGETLFQLQQNVGRCFAGVQGGLYADSLLEAVVDFVRRQGVTGVGQSSWGPTLYALTADEDRAQALVAQIGQRFDLEPGELLITQADNQGRMLSSQGVRAGW